MIKRTHNKGFTLVELVVAMGIFSLVMVVIMSIFVNYLAHQRRAVAEQQMLEEVRAFSELFHRETRTAYGETFTRSGNRILEYRNQNNHCVQYRWNSGDESIERSRCGGPWMRITPTHVRITRLEFANRSGHAGRQGHIRVSGIAESHREDVQPLFFQSAVTSRQRVRVSDP